MQLAKRIAHDLFGPPEHREFAIRYWDATNEQPPISPRFTLNIRRPAGLRRMLPWPTELKIAEAYIFGDLDVVGDLESATGLGDLVASRVASIPDTLSLLRHVLALPPDAASRAATAERAPRSERWRLRFGRAHSPHRDAQVVRFHYDVGNDFYALWLDRQMVYSCGYFANGNETLADAQAAKLDHVCRKLRLRAGDRLLDVGCGWGALAIHAARKYHARVVGITLSESQAAFARESIARERLEDRVRIEVRDYRSLDNRDRFDKIASVGMVEHVGRERLPQYFSAAYRCLAPGGLLLNHGIVSLERARPHRMLDPLWNRIWQRDQFIERYVFPDGNLVPSVDVIGAAEANGFELRDVESLREHYVKTLRHWVRRLERHHAEARDIVDEPTYRVWRLYMAASARAFRIGRIGVIQSLLAKPDGHGGVRLPPSRADLYAVETRLVNQR